MRYKYDPDESSMRGYYQCRECGQIINIETQHKKDCASKYGKDLIFVFGKKLVEQARTRQYLTGCESAITYGGLSIKLIKKYCPEALQ